MVVGATGTGKTSLLRLLLDTADISPTAIPEQRVAMERFLRGPSKRTESIQSVCVEICESRYDRVLLSVIDTPGLDFQDGHELKLDRQVTSIVKYLDSQFADTMSEESKVIRQSKGDLHIHLCIYMIDPVSIVSSSSRRAHSSLPTKTRSETTISHHPPDLSSISDDTTSDDTEEDAPGDLSMSPADIRVIRRLMTRANVLPVIARADSLTDDTLAAMKRVVRRDLHTAKLNFGVFGPVVVEPEPTNHVNGNETENGNGRDRGGESAEDDEDPFQDRRSRSVIKLRPTRPSTARASSRSRSRFSLSELANERATPDITDAESVASVRFSAQLVAKTDLSENLPFALITPEHVRRRRPLKELKVLEDHQSVHTETGRSVSMIQPSEDGHASIADSMQPSTPTSPTGAQSIRSFPYPYLKGPPADLKGVFTRKFRWGTVDVLSPEHCDFAAMRTAVLSTHMKMLKIRTKEVLYEKYRTEKLLARRATKNISESETRKLLEDLGL
ncbi:predicted protein [Sparassis crispa]|uniref:Septin-type G domain-containing protein n=1 Tax=Sparassis crispa TaxID=139825 RepID=A0A401GS71_9APHY|nr:predicted protein [Sparassis crispa]GBE85009.1 predicted protein [Sparassis crispa]